MRTRHAYLIGIVLAAPGILGAQEPRGAALSAEARQRVDAAMEAAVAANMPTAVLESRVAEGLAKGIESDRIAAAVESRLEALFEARSALEGAGAGERPDPVVLGAAAAALEAGASKEAVATLGLGTPPERRAVALAVLGHLVSRGHASDEALAAVSLAAERHADALLELAFRSGHRPDGRPDGGWPHVLDLDAVLDVSGRAGAGAGASVNAGAGASVRVGGRRPPR